MTVRKGRLEVPEPIEEEYYQINPDILDSFPKYHPPLNLYKFKEDIARIMPYFAAGGRLRPDQVEELAEMVKAGLVFVSREDHPVYVKHISHQLDLVLLDKHLKESEIADIFMEALTMRVADFFDQPVKAVYDRLETDILVLTEYLWQDLHRIRTLLRRLRDQHTQPHHAVNTTLVGLALYAQVRAEDFQRAQVKRKYYDHAAIGLMLHDLGMAKVPAFILEKNKPLSPDEHQKIIQHPKLGYAALTKLDLKYPEVEECILDHHERMNGSGYPQKKQGKELSIMAKLCAVADSFCAMITHRRYAPAMTKTQAATLLADDRRYDVRTTKLLQALILTNFKDEASPGHKTAGKGPDQAARPKGEE